MKKAFRWLGILVISLFSLFWTTLASNHVSFYEKESSTNSIVKNQDLSDNQIQPRGAKSRLVKQTIKLIANTLRNTSDDILRNVLKNRVEPKTVKKILNTKYEIADVLDEITLPLDYASTAIRSAVYQAIIPYLWHKIAWGLSGLVEFVLF